jgi:hypothetical protein
MSNNLIPTNIQVPAHLAARIGQQSSLAASLAAGLAQGGDSYPRISIKGARFRIVEGKTETVLDQTKLNVIIVGANPRLSKTFYAKQWDPNVEATGPDCFSLDGIGPDVSVQNPENDLCASCPKNAWGSKISPTGQQIKACADQKRLAIVAADDPTGPIYLLQVTPAALKGLNQFQKELTVRGIPLEVVQTVLSFDTNASFPKLEFNFGGFLDAAAQSAVDELFGSEQVLEITGEKTNSRPVEVPVQIERPAPVAPKPAPVEVVEEPVAPAPEATTPKRGFGAAKPAEPAPAAAAAVIEAAPKPKPAPVAVPENPEAMSLADEIAALVGGLDSDD